jgi:integrase
MLKPSHEWFKKKNLVKHTRYTVQQAVDDYVSHLRVKKGANSKGGIHNLIKAAILTGARYGELASAKVHDLDKVHGTLRLKGKTGKRDSYLSDDALTFFKTITKDRLPDAYWISV